MSARTINKAPVDAAARADALDPTRSFCVTAPAGSGKTELLSQRVLRLLAQAQQPEEILAITFTRKAAAEMQERILAALHNAQIADEPEAEHKRHTWKLARAALARDAELNWNLLQNPTRLRVMTIDGLCSSLTRQLPVLSTFGGSVAISDDSSALYRDAVTALFGLLEAEHPIADALADLLLHLDNDGERLQRLLIGLLANRDQWLRHLVAAQGAFSAEELRAHFENTLHRIIVDALNNATEHLRVYQGDLLPLLDFAGTRMRAMDPAHALCLFAGCTDLPPGETEAVAQWQLLTQLLLTTADDWRKQVDKRVGFPVGDNADDKKLCKARKESILALIDSMRDNDALLDALVGLRYLPAPRFSESQWQILRQLMVLLPVAVAQLKVIFQQRGEVDYTEVAQAALFALGEADNPGELLLRLDARIRHILVDEFQDTSSSQFRLLERLLEGWEEHNAIDEVQQTLFIVGDGMQSIYGFRAANVGLFLGARRHGINGVILDDAPLRVNFRSTPTIVGWVNQVFAHAFPAEEKIARGAVPYEPSSAFNSDRESSEVRLFGLRDDGEREREAAQCVALVKQSLAETEGDIAILVRNRSHLSAIVPALGAANIAWRAADIDPLAARTAVRDLLVLLKALSNLADRIAWLALLRSPLIGLDNDDLHKLVAGADGRGALRSVWAQIADTTNHAALSADGKDALTRAIDCIAPVLALRERKSRRSWLEGVWLALGGMLCLGGDDDWRDVQALFELIEDAADIDIALLETRVEQLYAKPLTSNGARLWLMTIHKSKGLEFETVIIPGLERAPRSDDKALLQWGEYLDDAGNSGLVLAASAAFGAETDAIYDWLDYERKQRQQLEDTRLFYVAATRAVSRLYLLFCDNRAPSQKNAEKPFAPGSRSLLARIWSAVESDVTWMDAAPQQISLLDPDGAQSEPETLWRVPPQWRLPNSQPVDETVSVAENIPDLATGIATIEAVTGTLIHKLFEQCVRFGGGGWRKRDAQQQGQLISALLRQQPIAESTHGEIANAVRHAINTALDDQRGRWLLDHSHAESVVEWELAVDENRRLRIDRSFIDSDGARWIVDYKTSQPFADETLAQFIARETESYREQLTIYRDAVAGLSTAPIRLALYFPAVPAWCEV